MQLDDVFVSEDLDEHLSISDSGFMKYLMGENHCTKIK